MSKIITSADQQQLQDSRQLCGLVYTMRVYGASRQTAESYVRMILKGVRQGVVTWEQLEIAEKDLPGLKDQAIRLNLQNIIRRLREEFISRSTGDAWGAMINAEIARKNGVTWKAIGTTEKELQRLIKKAAKHQPIRK